MVKFILKKYWIAIIIYTIFILILFLNKVNDNNPLPYINLIIYFIIFLIIKESLVKTKLNYFLVKLFLVFYFYLSIISSIVIAFRSDNDIFFYYYIYAETLMKMLLLLISFYIAIFNIKNKNKKFFYISLILSLFIITINYSKYLINPYILENIIEWSRFAVRNYATMVLAILALLIFWIRYYRKSVVVSEYLNIIIFLFTLSNIVEALHFVAFQYKFQIFIYGQIFIFILNLATLLFWYLRLVYLQSDLAMENERYLENYQYLGGLVSKPRPGIISTVIRFISIHSVVSVGLGIVLLLAGLYFIKMITFYLFLNTVFIFIAVSLALFLSFTSIKRDWQNQVGVLFKKKK